MRLPREAIEQLLDRWPIARLATLGEDGRPHQIPIVFARAGELLWSPVDGKPKAGGELTRIRNVRRNPNVAVLLDHYQADWTRLWWLRIDGVGEVVNPQSPENSQGVAALRSKYPQYDRVPLFQGEATLLRVRAETLRSWCATPQALAAIARSLESEGRSPGR